MVELQWTKAGLLDPFELKLGNWQFLSFSSSLAARSWLEVMSDKESNWFSGGWWGDHANSENQRKLLKMIEELRIKAKGSKAPPIRQIYVAWALIKLDNHLLFVQREDREREGVPNFVLPGGRLNIHDLRNNLEGTGSIGVPENPSKPFCSKSNRFFTLYTEARTGRGTWTSFFGIFCWRDL